MLQSSRAFAIFFLNWDPSFQFKYSQIETYVSFFSQIDNVNDMKIKLCLWIINSKQNKTKMQKKKVVGLGDTQLIPNYSRDWGSLAMAGWQHPVTAACMTGWWPSQSLDFIKLETVVLMSKVQKHKGVMT